MEHEKAEEMNEAAPSEDKPSGISSAKPQFIIAPAKRPPNPLNKWIKEKKNSYQITSKDIGYIYRNVIFATSHKELRKIFENEKKRDELPALVVAIIASHLGDVARGNNVNLSRVLSFVFPNLKKGFDPDELDSKLSVGGYSQIRELEDALKRLEGDDSIMIVDKFIAAEDAEYQVNGGGNEYA